MSLENFAKFPEYLKKIEEIVDGEVEKGLKSIFYVGTGGTYSYGLPFKYMLISLLTCLSSMRQLLN